MAQEVCDNGVDDDADGLVDILDPECECTGIYIEGPSNAIPNGSFEDQICCPQSFSEMNCASPWQQGNNATTDYIHTCGFVLSAIFDVGLIPFPSGNGVAGMVWADSWKEYLSTCLNEPLEAGTEFTFTLQVAMMSINNNGSACQGGFPTNFGPVNLTLYGHPDCNNLNVGGTGCPSGVDPNWIELGFVTYTPQGAWGEVSFTFTPPVTINAIMLGPPCNLPPGYSGVPCYAYMVVDDLQLSGETLITDLEILTIGQPCNFAYALDAFVDHQGGTWQWYFNGAAIPGQTQSTLPLSENNYQSGKYYVRYDTPDGCIIDSIQIDIPGWDTLEVEVFFCPGSSISCAGETYYVPGTYEVNLLTPLGCDSVVTCIVTEYDLVPPTIIDIDTCGPVSIPICNEVVTETGYYEIYCTDYRGCDSIVVLDLRVMTPEAVITPPPLLDCHPLADVVLDGSVSPLNPIPSGNTYYEWSGPVDGFNSDLYEPWAIVTKPGKYCLTLTYENNGVSCTDTACVTVMSSAALPDQPDLTGPIGGCPGDTLTFQLGANGTVPHTGYAWSLPAGALMQQVNDSTVWYFLDQPGTMTLCGWTFNECGSSDSICVQILTANTDTIFMTSTTCNPGSEGVFTTSQLNQFGCDSIVVETVNLVPSYFTEVVLTTCDPAQAGADTLFLASQYGCDSIIATRTDLLPSHFTPLTLYTCDSLAAGKDTLWLSNQYGCDSVVAIDLVFTGSFQEETTTRICGAGTNYTDSLLITTGPCDSLYITHYEYIPLDTTWMQSSTCNPGQAGTFVTVLPASTGCDSTLITEIAFVPLDTTWQLATTCDPAMAGTQVTVLLTPAGCDSVLVVQTDLLPSHAVQVDTFTCDPGSAGQQVVVLSNQYGCDSIVTIVTEYRGVDTQFVQLFTCLIQEAGIASEVIPGTWCDTVRVTETLYIPSSFSRDTQIVCGAQGPLSDTLFLTNTAGCDSLAVTDFVYVLLEAEVETTDERCAGDRNGLIAVSGLTGALPPVMFRLGSGPWQTDTAFADLTPGTYTLFAEDARGCRDTLSGLLIQPGALLEVFAGDDQLVEFGENAPIQATSSHVLAQLLWSATDPVDCEDCPSTWIGPVEENQTVTLWGMTAEGCEDTDELSLLVRKQVKVFIPNSFSPDLDGINDIFSIYGNRFVKSVRNLAIYDRWGNALYDRADLPINDPSQGWDGSFRDKFMDPGVYIYVVEVELTDGSFRLYKGDVTLISSKK